MIKLMIAEDNDVVRQGLIQVLSGERCITVVGDASDGNAALQLLYAGLDCNVLLVDLNMPVMDGFELSDRVRAEFPHLKVIVLTMHAKSDFLQRAREAGVAGYLLKQIAPEELADSIRLIVTGICLYMLPRK